MGKVVIIIEDDHEDLSEQRCQKRKEALQKLDALEPPKARENTPWKRGDGVPKKPFRQGKNAPQPFNVALQPQQPAFCAKKRGDHRG